MSLPYTFTPPTVDEGPAGTDWLFMRYKLRRGISVLKTNGLYVQARYPSQDDVEAADVAYIGGYLYFVDPTEAQALVNAGYPVDTVDPINFPIPTANGNVVTPPTGGGTGTGAGSGGTGTGGTGTGGTTTPTAIAFGAGSVGAGAFGGAA